MVDRQVRDRQIDRARLRFSTHVNLDRLPVEQRQTSHGSYRLAVPELVACDLADRPREGGGLSNVATVLSELAADGNLAGDRLAELAARVPHRDRPPTGLAT